MDSAFDDDVVHVQIYFKALAETYKYMYIYGFYSSLAVK